jgi:ATP-dependent DNA helicase DinG
LAEWAESQGKNAFYEIAVPDAALRLVQACGRLIRHEGDYGRITLLDKRIVTKRYGRDLLESLPPYKLQLNGA